ncbi:MAG: hypothetical protein WAV45_12830 [Propionibacteriaceae bacterium]|nr:hypothetical protein [Micropruina sp.]
MATWRDGPEYAPVERPVAFATPDAPPLPQPPPRVLPAQPPSALRPLDYQTADLPPLSTYVPADPDARDPRASFDVSSSPMTSAWDAAHSGGATAGSTWTPETPIVLPGTAVMQLPQPAGAWAPPSAQLQPFPTAVVPPAPPAQVGAKEMLEATSPAVVIAFLLGAILPWVSLAFFGMGWWLSTKVRYRRATVATVTGWLGAGVGVVAALTYFDGGTYGLVPWWNQIAPLACVACWIALITLPLIQGAAMRAGERPEA